jgi:hypothetical protein
VNDQESAPDIYADGFQVTVTPFGVNMSFSLREAHPNPDQPPAIERVATVRMSPAHTKIVAMMLAKQIRKYERDNSLAIAVPAEVYKQLGIAEEDWGT